MPFFEYSERCPEILNYNLVSYLSFLVDEQDERYIYYEIFPNISGGLVWVKTFRSDSVSLRMKKATLRTRLDTLNKPINGQSKLNLNPRLSFCRLKWRWIAFQKAMKCSHWRHGVIDDTDFIQIKKWKPYSIHITEVIKEEWDTYIVCPCVNTLSRSNITQKGKTTASPKERNK